MKFYLFTLLLFGFSFSSFAQNNLSPDENGVTFILNISKILHYNLQSLKGEFIKTEANGKDSIFTCTYLVPGFTTYIKSGSNGQTFDAVSGTPPLPFYNSLTVKLSEFMYSMGYSEHDSQKDPALKAQADRINLKRMHLFFKKDYETNDVDEGLNLYLFQDGTYAVAIFNQTAKEDAAKARKAAAEAKLLIVPKREFKYIFNEAPNKWSEFSNKQTSSVFKNGKWLISNKAPYPKIINGWQKSFMLDFNSMDAVDFELTGSFTNIASIDTAYYGYTFTAECKDDVLYHHVDFLFNKKNHTFSVYTFPIKGDQLPSEGVKNYIVKNKACTAPKSATADVLGVRRYKGNILFSVNNEVVYSMVDGHAGCMLSSAPNVMAVNKAELEVDDMLFNYSPDSESTYFKMVPH